MARFTNSRKKGVTHTMYVSVTPSVEGRRELWGGRVAGGKAPREGKQALIDKQTYKWKIGLAVS